MRCENHWSLLYEPARYHGVWHAHEYPAERMSLRSRRALREALRPQPGCALQRSAACCRAVQRGATRCNGIVLRQYCAVLAVRHRSRWKSSHCDAHTTVHTHTHTHTPHGRTQKHRNTHKHTPRTHACTQEHAHTHTRAHAHLTHALTHRSSPSSKRSGRLRCSWRALPKRCKCAKAKAAQGLDLTCAITTQSRARARARAHTHTHTHTHTNPDLREFLNYHSIYYQQRCRWFVKSLLLLYYYYYYYYTKFRLLL
jgi:hypothetical protein